MDIITATQIPVGATVERVYWKVPGHYGTGPEFDTRVEALQHAVEATRAAVARHNDHYADTIGTSRFVPLPERITIELRWKMSWPAPASGGTAGVDTMIDRVEYVDIAAAEEAAARFGGRRLTA